MIPLPTLAPPGYEWKYNDEAMRWELGRFVQDFRNTNLRSWMPAWMVTTEAVEMCMAPEIVIVGILVSVAPAWSRRMLHSAEWATKHRPAEIYMDC